MQVAAAWRRLGVAGSCGSGSNQGWCLGRNGFQHWCDKLKRILASLWTGHRMVCGRESSPCETRRPAFTVCSSCGLNPRDDERWAALIEMIRLLAVQHAACDMLQSRKGISLRMPGIHVAHSKFGWGSPYLTPEQVECHRLSYGTRSLRNVTCEESAFASSCESSSRNEAMSFRPMCGCGAWQVERSSESRAGGPRLTSALDALVGIKVD